MAWATLLALLSLAGCKPREVLCRPRAFFQVIEPEQGAKAVPFQIDRIGREVKRSTLGRLPTFLSFVDDNRARTEWLVLGHIWGKVDVIYSPEQGLARAVDDPSYVLPMKRFADGSSERVKLGFRSQLCLDTDELAGKVPCREYGQEEQFLVADMPCERR